MEIGIIGAGQIGGTLTRLLAKLGPHGAGRRTRATRRRSPNWPPRPARPRSGRRTPPVDADLVIVSIPQKNVPDLAPGIVATGKPARR